ncbi:MAG: O-antigen ligase family protein [Tissierellia bacterium]|nr:O-antigen ligase family protein [Tissierellia bacterium]
MKLIVYLGLVASLYNILANFSEMFNILNINNPYAVNFSSFYLNRNSFAQLLFMATIANTFLYTNERTKFNLICYFIFSINIFATLSRTVIACVLIFFSILLIIHFRKEIKAQNFILTLIISLVIIIRSNQEVSSFITNMIIRKDYGTSGRLVLWNFAFEILNKTNWVLGIGYISSVDIIKRMGYSLNEFHSFYIETLVGGGIIDLFLHILIFIFCFKNVKIIYYNDNITGIVYFAAYISFLLYGLVESVSFFTMGYVGTLFTIFIVTIPLLYSNSFKYGGCNDKCK